MSAEHQHAPAEFNRAFAIGIALNAGFVAIEGFYGWKVDSLALLADAGHNLSDVAGLVLAWGGALSAARGGSTSLSSAFAGSTSSGKFACFNRSSISVVTERKFGRCANGQVLCSWTKPATSRSSPPRQFRKGTKSEASTSSWPATATRSSGVLKMTQGSSKGSISA